MGDIFITGNTAIDAMRYTVKPDFVFPTQLLNELDFRSRRVIAVTCHRRENYGQPMANIMTALRRVADAFPEVELVYPVHLSPVVREAAGKYASEHLPPRRARPQLVPMLTAATAAVLLTLTLLMLTGHI